jgi:hypothetical protein
MAIIKLTSSGTYELNAGDSMIIDNRVKTRIVLELQNVQTGRASISVSLQDLPEGESDPDNPD